ncbi:MAG: hypothetical protein PWP10_4186, partial [Clostridiales bacterium]|nr:hypothetical protein [Clostridiales bacterium]
EDVIGREELAAIVREQVEAALGKTDIQD